MPAAGGVVVVQPLATTNRRAMERAVREQAGDSELVPPAVGVGDCALLVRAARDTRSRNMNIAAVQGCKDRAVSSSPLLLPPSPGLTMLNRQNICPFRGICRLRNDSLASQCFNCLHAEGSYKYHQRSSTTAVVVIGPSHGTMTILRA